MRGRGFGVFLAAFATRTGGVLFRLKVAPPLVPQLGQVFLDPRVVGDVFPIEEK